MKYRNSFISNSSSMSFTCAVCGEEIDGWDWELSYIQLMSEGREEAYICSDHYKDVNELIRLFKFKEILKDGKI